MVGAVGGVGVVGAVGVVGVVGAVGGVGVDLLPDKLFNAFPMSIDSPTCA